MPQPKRTSSSTAAKGRAGASGAKPKAATTRAAAKKPAARSTAAKPRAAASKSSRSAAGTSAAAKAPARRATATKATAKPAARRKTAAGAGTRAGATRPAAARPAAGRPGDAFAPLVRALRKQLSDRVFDPLDLVLLAGTRIQEALDEAVERGRMSRGDANDLAGELVRRGRKQTDEVLGNLDELLGKGLEQLEQLSKRASRARRADSVDRIIRSADKVRRSAGVGPSFPIIGYDDLSAPKIADRLGDLKPAELRKVRDYEARHANRKSVLAAIDKALK